MICGTPIGGRSVWEALGQSGLEYSDWIVRQEYDDAKPCIHLYGEFLNGLRRDDVLPVLHESLRAQDPFYGDLEDMLDISPLRVTCLSPGTFDRFYDEKQRDGLPLPQRRPLRMRATDSSVDDLLRLSGVGQSEGAA